MPAHVTTTCLLRAHIDKGLIHLDMIFPSHHQLLKVPHHAKVRSTFHRLLSRRKGRPSPPQHLRQKRLHPGLIRSRILAEGRTMAAPQFGKRLGLAGSLVQPLPVREYDKHVAAAVAYQHRALDLL